MSHVDCSIAKCLILFCCVCAEAKKLNSWRDQDSLILGSPPTQRFGHGFTETLGRLYIFGGTTLSQGIDMKCLSVAISACYLEIFVDTDTVYVLAVYLNDLHQFDLSTLTWTDLSNTFGPDSDIQPTARFA